MKKLRKVLALVLAMVMVLAMGITAFAANGAIGDITINGAIKDATYTAYKIFDATYSGENAVSYTIPSGSTITSVDGFANVFTTTQKGTLTYVTKKGSDSEVIAWLKANETSIATSGNLKATVTNSTGLPSVILETRESGYYYIKATIGTTGDTSFKSAVTIDSAHPTATVNSKISDQPIVPEDGKKINGNSVNTMQVGEAGSFTLTFNATNYSVDEDGTATLNTSYTITDTMNGFSISDDQLAALTVTVGGTSVSSTQSNDAPYFTAQKTTTGLQVVIMNYDKGNYTSPSTVVVTYDANLTNKNLANASTNTFSVDKATGSSTTYTYNYTVDITKVDKADNNTKLSGAKFVLKNKEDKYYSVDSNGVVSWEVDLTNATEVTTGTDGKANFQGLAAGNYTLVETEAPAGYTLAADTPVTLAVVNGMLTDNTSLTVHLTVEDQAGSTLPSTGGMGTTLFYVFGAVLVIGAGIILVARRRMAKGL